LVGLYAVNEIAVVDHENGFQRVYLRYDFIEGFIAVAAVPEDNVIIVFRIIRLSGIDLFCLSSVNVQREFQCVDRNP
jgi:hypothetical protein